LDVNPSHEKVYHIPDWVELSLSCDTLTFAFFPGFQFLRAALVAERCRVVNDKKAALDAKTDTSVSTQRLELLERELEDLKERVRATERLIQDEKNLIASSKQEAEDLTTLLKTELAELSTLSRQIVLGEDKDDEAAISEDDRVHLEAIGAINEFLQ
jgi:hypothetical protein